MNWHTLFTEKLIWGIVIVAYCNAPATDLYRVGSEKVVEPILDSLQPLIIGELMRLDPYMFVLNSKSQIYLDWVRNKEPFFWGLTSIPRK